MAVVTGFHRVKEDTIRKLEADPELMDWLLGYSHDARDGARLGFADGVLPPRLAIGKAWDEILLLLAATDHYKAYQALHISLWEEYDGYEEIRLFSPTAVKSCLEALEPIEIERLRGEALRRDLRTYDGDPIRYLLDNTLSHLESLRDFWREAARAGEAIISGTG